MKKNRPILSRWPVLLALLFLIPGGCKKDPIPSPDNDIDPRNATVAIAASIENGSGQYPWVWEEGELVSVFTTGASVNSNTAFDFTAVSAEGTSGSLSGVIRQTKTGTHTFSAVYPYYNTNSDPLNYMIEVPVLQNITTGGIDPSTYFLTAKPTKINIRATGNVSISEMKFSSPLTIVKLAFTNSGSQLASDETITGIRFSAENRDITGRGCFDLTTGEFAGVSASNSSLVNAMYPENAAPEAGTGFDGWFTAFPFELAAGAKYAITLLTDRQTLSATITVAEKLAFSAGKVSTLAVKIDGRFESDIPLEEQWARIDSADDIESGDYVIASYSLTASKWFAMSNVVTPGTANPAGTEITLSADETVLAEGPAENIVWKFTGDKTTGFTVSSAVPSYLQAANIAQGLSIASTDPAQLWTFTTTPDYGLLMRCGAVNATRSVSLYYSASNGYDWRYYIPGNHINFYLFKKGAGVPQRGASISTTAVSGVTFDGATLNGTYSHPSAMAQSAGFVYGTSPTMLNTDIPATIDGQSFSATLDGLPKGTRYYYRAYIVINGKRDEGVVRNFRTALPGPTGKSWTEIPNVVSGEGLIAKTYYETMKDGKWGRNYSLLYDPSEKLALWVAFPMHASTHLGDIPRVNLERWSFDNDGDIPVAYQPSIVGGSYKEADYDRGHQIAAADRNGALEAGRQTFYITNMTPQHFNLNRGVWARLEDAVRGVAVATTQTRDTLYVVTGPLMTTKPAVRFATDLAGTPCPVPDGFFKVILWSKYEGGSRKYDSIGFIFDNQTYASSGKSFSDMAATVSEVERQTGFTFFDNLGLGQSEMGAVKSTSAWSSFTNRGTNPK